MLFCVLTDPRFPCPRTHMLHVRKLGEGFIQRGYHYRELSRVDEILHLSPCDILYVSNHFSCELIHRQFAKVLWRSLFGYLVKTQAKLILWYFHTLPDWDLLHKIKAPIVHLGEDLNQEAIDREEVLKKFRDKFPVLALKYASPLHPHHSSRFDFKREYDFNFVGHGYCRELTEHCAKNYQTLIRNTPPTISEPLRVNSFRRSEINLVFHSEDNKRKGVVIERFAEALSYGGILFHDHPRITQEFTDVASVIQVNSTSDIDREYNRIMALAPEDRKKMRQQSFEVWKVRGLSYFDQAARVLAAFK